MDWSLYKNFSREEMKCKYSGECAMRPEFMHLLQSVREKFGKPIFISSGYRSAKHPVESMKDKNEFSAPGIHTLGMAADIICHGRNAVDIMSISLRLGVTRIGVHQKGNTNSRFIHIDIGDKCDPRYLSTIWTY